MNDIADFKIEDAKCLPLSRFVRIYPDPNEGVHGKDPIANSIGFLNTLDQKSLRSFFGRQAAKEVQEWLNAHIAKA